MLKEQIDSLLDRVQKPARYMGGEMNCVLKDPNSVDIRYAFAFPDVYEVGMSHLGSRILYDIINKREDGRSDASGRRSAVFAGNTFAHRRL